MTTEWIADVDAQQWMAPSGTTREFANPGGSGGGGGSALSTYLIATTDALARSDVVTVSNGTNYVSQGGTDRTYDARGATIAASPVVEADAYVCKVGNSTKGTRTAWVGGLIRTNLSTALHWDEVKGSWDGAGILFGANEWLLVDGTRFYNVQDAIRPRYAGSNKRWCVRNCWFYYIRDDVIENDSNTTIAGGRIHDCLVEGTFMFLSQQGSGSWDGNEDMTITRSLVRLLPMPYRYDANPDPGDEPQLNTEYGNDADRHGHLFKQFGTNDYPLHITNSVLYVEQHTVDAQTNMRFPTHGGSSYSNVTLIWKGYEPSAYPYALPAGITEMNLLTHTEAELDAFWDAAVAEWKTRHGFAADAFITDTPLDASKMIAPDDFGA